MERPNLPALGKTFREAGKEFDGNFAVPPLRLKDAGDGNELFGYGAASFGPPSIRADL